MSHPCRRVVLVLALAASLVVLPYVTGMLLPWYGNGLDALPLSEVASGRHDPKDLWPQGPIGGLVQLFGFFSLAPTPLGVMLVGLACAAVAGAAGRDRFHCMTWQPRGPSPLNPLDPRGRDIVMRPVAPRLLLERSGSDEE